jgi:peptidoglycan/LPS O-acetylase OafA/YrhL
MFALFGMGNTAPAWEARECRFFAAFGAGTFVARALAPQERHKMRTILLIILILLILGALPTWPYSTGWGYYPSGGLGLLLVILLILAVLGKL